MVEWSETNNVQNFIEVKSDMFLKIYAIKYIFSKLKSDMFYRLIPIFSQKQKNWKCFFKNFRLTASQSTALEWMEKYYFLYSRKLRAGENF